MLYLRCLILGSEQASDKGEEFEIFSYPMSHVLLDRRKSFKHLLVIFTYCLQ